MCPQLVQGKSLSWSRIFNALMEEHKYVRKEREPSSPYELTMVRRGIDEYGQVKAVNFVVGLPFTVSAWRS